MNETTKRKIQAAYERGYRRRWQEETGIGLDPDVRVPDVSFKNQLDFLATDDPQGEAECFGEQVANDMAIPSARPGFLGRQQQAATPPVERAEIK